MRGLRTSLLGQKDAAVAFLLARVEERGELGEELRKCESIVMLSVRGRDTSSLLRCDDMVVVVVQSPAAVVGCGVKSNRDRNLRNAGKNSHAAKSFGCSRFIFISFGLPVAQEHTTIIMRPNDSFIKPKLPKALLDQIGGAQISRSSNT